MPSIADPVNKLFSTPQESEKLETSQIEGTLPRWLTGTFLRVGPAMFTFENGFEMNHWLDGYAMLQKFEIDGSAVTFEKRYVQSDAYKRGIAANAPMVNEFGTAAQRDPNKGFFSRIVSAMLPEFTDNNYASVYAVGNNTDIFISCDTCYFRRIDGRTLETCEKYDSNKLFGLNGQTAHPILDTETGDVYNLGFNILPTAKYSFVRLPKSDNAKEMFKKSKILATIPSRWSGTLCLLHSFGMSKNYLVFIEQPMTASVSKIASTILKSQTLLDIMEWKAEEKTRFYIVEKSSGRVIKTEFLSSDSFYFLHVVNCYEEKNQIVIDLITHENPKVLKSLSLCHLRQSSFDLQDAELPGLQRFVIPIIEDIKSVKEGVDLIQGAYECTAFRDGNKILLHPADLTQRGLELPVINRQFAGKSYRYIYTSGTFNSSNYKHKVCKTDIHTLETKTWEEGDFLYPGEPMFVANPNGSSEDDGVVICTLTDARTDCHDFLLFLDASTFTEIGRAKFQSHIPCALHGLFLESKKE